VKRRARKAGLFVQWKEQFREALYERLLERARLEFVNEIEELQVSAYRAGYLAGRAAMMAELEGEQTVDGAGERWN
jgi:hypothetical protein